MIYFLILLTKREILKKLYPNFTRKYLLSIIHAAESIRNLEDKAVTKEMESLPHGAKS